LGAIRELNRLVIWSIQNGHADGAYVYTRLLCRAIFRNGQTRIQRGTVTKPKPGRFNP
jgi:hypothetical protein